MKSRGGFFAVVVVVLPRMDAQHLLWRRRRRRQRPQRLYSLPEIYGDTNLLDVQGIDRGLSMYTLSVHALTSKPALLL